MMTWFGQGPMREYLTQPIPAAVTIFLVINAPLQAMLWWFSRRERRASAERIRRWRQEDAAWQRRWDLQRQVWDAQRSPEEIEWDRRAQARAAAVRREARRRLGLPEEEG
jgi:uncharacterized membrane protein YdbT with pleckstrin-like domain